MQRRARAVHLVHPLLHMLIVEAVGEGVARVMILRLAVEPVRHSAIFGRHQTVLSSKRKPLFVESLPHVANRIALLPNLHALAASPEFLTV